MPTQLPTDQNNLPIPALRLKDGRAHKITVGAASARNSVGFESDTQIISLYATVPVYIRLGTGSVTATTSDHYFPAGTYYDIAVGGDGVAQSTHIAVLRESSDGILYVSEKT